MEGLQSSRAMVRFGAFELDSYAGELRKQGTKIRLQEQPLQILRILLEHPGAIIMREELRQKIWPSDTFVDFDHGINNAIKRLREALGDTAETPRYIETLPRRGYRFIGTIERDAPSFRSLAVLPLENLSRDPEQEYFAEGLTDALITTLAKIGGLRVISRTSVAVYKGVRKPLPEIARELEVDTIVEGTVMRAGNRVRITAQLIDAQKESHLWAESYDRHLRDVLDLQSEVAQAIAHQVQVKVTPQEKAHFAQTRPVDPDAYEAYLKGRYHWNRRSGEGLGKAAQHFRQAVASDPNYAAAYSGLADCVSIFGWWAYVSPEQGCGQGKALALKALELDPDLAEAHTSLAWATAFYDYDFARSEREYRRAIELNPRYATAHAWYGLTLSMIRDDEEALAQLKQGVRLDPASAIINGMMALGYWFARQYDASLEYFQKGADLEPASSQMHWGLGVNHVAKGNYDSAVAEMEIGVQLTGGTPISRAFLASAYAAAAREPEADRLLRQLTELSHTQYVSPYILSWSLAAMKRTDQALAQLEGGYRERAAWMVWMKRDPHFDILRSDPRFRDLLRRMNFPP